MDSSLLEYFVRTVDNMVKQHSIAYNKAIGDGRN